jgi:hypothetical protein
LQKELPIYKYFFLFIDIVNLLGVLNFSLPTFKPFKLMKNVSAYHSPSYKMALLGVFLLIVMGSCKDYLDLLIPPKDKPKCKIDFFTFSNAATLGDTTYFAHGIDGRISSFRRVSWQKNGTIMRRDGDLFYNAQGLLEKVNYPLTDGVLTFQYENKHLRRLTYTEKGELVQEYDVTTDAKGLITSMTGKGLNNTKVVYTNNNQGYVSLLERFDQAGNRLAWNVNDSFDAQVKHSLRDVYPNIPVFIWNNIATISFEPQPPSTGPWQKATFYSATDAQGNYNGEVKKVDFNVDWTVTKEGYVYDRCLTTSTGLSGCFHYRYTNCQGENNAD